MYALQSRSSTIIRVPHDMRVHLVSSSPRNGLYNNSQEMYSPGQYVHTMMEWFPTQLQSKRGGESDTRSGTVMWAGVGWREQLWHRMGMQSGITINQVGHRYRSPRSVNLAARQDRVASVPRVVGFETQTHSSACLGLEGSS